MTIERTESGFQAMCDGAHCNEYLEAETPEGDWSVIMDALEECDWHKKRVGNGWVHICPACREEEMEQQRKDLDEL